MITTRAMQGFGKEVIGFEPRTATEDSVADLLAQVYENKVLVLRGERPLSAGEYTTLGKTLGSCQIYLMDNYRHPEFPEVYVSSNYPERELGVSRTGYYWHSDCSFEQEPLSLTMLCPQKLDGLRLTHYIDMEKVLESLPSDMLEMMSQMRLVHDNAGFYKLRARDVGDGMDLRSLDQAIYQLCPGAVHPAIVTHPVTKRRSAYFSEFATSVIGLNPGSSARFIERLRRHCYATSNMLTVEWKCGDIVLWDNRSVIHKGGGIEGETRAEAWRMGVYDGHPFYAEDIRTMGRLKRHHTAFQEVS